jgi:hypothetical protein
MKKFFALMMVFSALVVAGCTKSETTPPPAESTAPPAEGTTETPATETPAEPANP